MKNSALAELHILSSLKGHDKEKITINDDNPKKRAQLAEKVVALIRDGFSILLSDGRHVRGYDAETNEWLVASDARIKTESSMWDRISAIGQSANAVAPGRGG